MGFVRFGSSGQAKRPLQRMHQWVNAVVAMNLKQSFSSASEWCLRISWGLVSVPDDLMPITDEAKAVLHTVR
ncbi:Kallikrein-9 [Frankliniella fusca]|uniref:Kallikrein-9 n=1 Tax=Frankliniella fusca TaxID=407009 RepID=A0AAE1LLR2_9NEOP|nr:Kallikrein-9 [Frankliniella fusca]KAK3917053.1 Kallikrein-9 [Frankliniella fusca]KAK3917064.1 Kallikrein-9 [Frankliniella fusca]KAK3924333.1 Kallikrein-9 [Frankliniella fusca]KAK3926925.1 Kallikrein-9 [Frankliniella fusca]